MFFQRIIVLAYQSRFKRKMKFHMPERQAKNAVKRDDNMHLMRFNTLAHLTKSSAYTTTRW